MFRRKTTYRFNPHTLSYETVVVTFRDRIKKISTTLLLGVVLGCLFSLIGYRLFDTQKERELRRELERCRRQLKVMNEALALDEQVLANLENRDTAIYFNIFGTPPLASKIHLPQAPDVSAYSGGLCGKEIASTTLRIDSLTRRLYSLSRLLDETQKMVSGKQQRMAAMPAIMPIKKDQCRLMSGFGWRYHPILHYRRMHTGVDFSAQQGTPVYATADGVVRVAGRQGGGSGYGVQVVVDHGYGFQTLYGHLKAVSVRPGRRVKRGEQIGTVGRSGLASGNHLHYEVIQNGEKVNPVYFFFNDLTPSEYEEILQAANQENQCLS